MTNIEHSRPKEHDILEKTQDRVGGIECALQSLSDHPIIKFLKSLFFKKKESEAKKNSIPVSPTGASKSRNDWTGGMSEETYRTILMQAKNAKPEDFDRIIDAIPELPKMTVSADKELTKDAAEAMRKIIHENPATLALHGKLGQEKNTLMKRIKIFTTMAANESEFLDVGKQLSAVREKSLTEGRRLSEGKSLRALLMIQHALGQQGIAFVAKDKCSDLNGAMAIQDMYEHLHRHINFSTKNASSYDEWLEEMTKHLKPKTSVNMEEIADVFGKRLFEGMESSPIGKLAKIIRGGE